MNDTNLMKATANVAAAYFTHNATPVDEVGKVIAAIGEGFASLGKEPEPVVEQFVPAVPVRGSVKPGYILSLIDGRKYKMLKRHLSLHGLTPEQYRDRYKLPADYPMVAPEYAAKRRELAVKIGLGRKPGQRRGRHKKAA